MADSGREIDARGGLTNSSNVAVKDGSLSKKPIIGRGRQYDGAAKRTQYENGRVNGEAEGSELTELAKLIEGEVIPRLVLAHSRDSVLLSDQPSNVMPPEAEDVADFARLLVHQDPAEAAAYVDAMRERGVELDTLLLDIMAPAARLLGDWWVADLCDFADVTIGLSRLQVMLRDLSPAFDGDVGAGKDGRRALLAPMPGEQHTFGVFMVQEFFRRSGWEVYGGTLTCNDELLEAVRDQPYALVGLSVSHDGELKELASLIPSIRKRSCNPRISVMVGGQVFIRNPDFATEVGADGMAADGRGAVAQAESLFLSVGERC